MAKTTLPSIDAKQIAALFPQDPTVAQMHLVQRFAEFLRLEEELPVFLLSGYAGTGKTTSVAALLKLLPRYKFRSVLLAPTGRAAKVLSQYTGQSAFTIHKKIYRKKGSGDAIQFDLAPNIHSNTIFFVDEASMIADQQEGFGFSSKGLLSDLFQFVYNNKGCGLVLVGDPAQLPPVGLVESPALDKEYLERNFGASVTSIELTEVVRQQQDSGILFNATALRNTLQEEDALLPQLTVKGFKDIYRMNGDKLVDGLNYAYDKFGIENTLMVCRSNKSANEYNRQIRNRILYREEELSSGDYLMIVKNNYFWLPEDSDIGFIANGDIARIKRLRNEQEIYGQRFVDAQLELIDYAGKPVIDCKLMLDTLTSESPALTGEQSKAFYAEVMKDYQHIRNRRQQFEELKKNPFYNALQVKFSYAVTCHKAQGGQWDAVFVDQGYLTADKVNAEFNRWLYTALTRSVKELFLVNFNADFFEQ